MTNSTVSLSIDSGHTAYILVSMALVQLMMPGLAFFYGGLLHKHSVVTMLMQNFAAMGVVTVIWFAFGFSLCFGHSYTFWGSPTAFGGFMAGVAGAYLSLYYPGSWNENISSGQGLIAVALVIFARWNPLACLGAALIFGGAGALGPALQSVGVTSGYYLFYAAPYILTLAILFATSSPRRALEGAPRELSITK